MDDLKLLLIKLNCEPQPLTANETALLNKISQALLKDNSSISSDQVEILERQDYNWISRPENIKFTLETTNQTKTVFQTEQIIKVSHSSSQDGVYTSISSAISASKENSTIILEVTDCEESVIVDRSLHFVAAEGSSFSNVHFDIRAGLATFSGFNINTDVETFAVTNGQLSLKDCTINSNSLKPIISVCQSASLEVINSTLKGNKIIDAQVGSFIIATSSTFAGNSHFVKSDSTFTNCALSNPFGICLEALSTILNVKNSDISNSKEVAISAREHCQLIIENTTIHDISGAGILLNNFSRMQATKININKCQKAGLIVTHDAAAKLTGAEISDCHLSGCEVLYKGQLECNESWISENKGSCILSDYRSLINLTRCVIDSGETHGIEAAGASVCRLNDTLIRRCRGSGVFVSSSNIIASMCEFLENCEVTIIGEDNSMIDLTNCQIVGGLSDGIEAINGSSIVLNSCYFECCKGNHIAGRGCREIKINSTTFQESIYTIGDKKVTSEMIASKVMDMDKLNIYGGLSFDQSDTIVMDTCYFNRNSLVISSCKNCIARNSKFQFCITRGSNKIIKYIEIVEGSEMLIENCVFAKNCIKVRRATLTVRKSRIHHAKGPAFYAESGSTINLENNEISYCVNCVTAKDNTHVQFSLNKVTNISKKAKKEDIRIKAINIKEFSDGVIERNFISGDYDYAIYADGQSKVDCTTNQIQIGSKTGIMYGGMSYGKCEDNEFIGKGKPIDYYKGFTPSQM